MLELRIYWEIPSNQLYVAGKGNKPYISLPKGKGVKLSIAEERDKRLAK